ncbi:MAG: CoA-binding protein [Bradymonadales bacterium]|nr:CoA-binding protein [Bradymonadales bacterium]
MNTLRKFFLPRSVAVIGASADPAKVGYALLRNALYGSIEGPAERSRGFDGKIFAVNARGAEVLGLQSVRSVSEIPEPVDLAVVAIPAPSIPKTVEECGNRGIQAVVVITAGFSEVGPEGHRLEQEMVEAARRTGVRIIGPNCLGVIAAEQRLNVSFAYRSPPPGSISLLSQSGALCTALISYAFEEHVGYRHFVSMGDKCDVEDAEVIDYFAEDEKTSCIALYIEALKQPRAFYEAARRATRRKPVVAIKVGRTAAGARAASSHTGSIAGSDAAYQAAFRQSGVQRVHNLASFIDATRALSSQPLPRGKRICVLTNAGGPGVITADTLHDLGLDLVKLSSETIDKLNRHCPAAWSHGNPADIIGDAGPERYLETLRIINQADEVDGIVLIMTHQSMSQPMQIAKAVIDLVPELTKPITVSFIGQEAEQAEDLLEEAGIPEFNFPERAADAMGALCTRADIVRRHQEEVPS